MFFLDCLLFKPSTSFSDGGTCVPNHAGFEIAKTVTWTNYQRSHSIVKLCVKSCFLLLSSCAWNVRQDDCLTAEQETKPANNKSSGITQSTHIEHHKLEYSASWQIQK